MSNAPFSAQPAKEVIKRYTLVSLLSPPARKDTARVRDFSKVDQAIFFEGNVTLDEHIDINTNGPCFGDKDC